MSPLLLHDDGLHAGDVAVAVEDDDNVLVGLAPHEPVARETKRERGMIKCFYRLQGESSDLGIGWVD